VVVVRCAGEAPGVSVVAASIGVRGVAHVDGTDCRTSLTIDTGDRVGGRVRIAVIGHVVRRDYDGGVSLADGVGDRGGCDVVVVRCAGEAPGAGVVAAGLG